MTLIKTSILTAISTIIKILSGFVIVKVIAVYAGPTGLALLGQLQNFLSIVTTVGQGGTSAGVVKYLAEYREDEETKRRLISTAFKISLWVSLLISIILLLGASFWSSILFDTDKYTYIIIVLAFTLLFFVLSTLLLSILNGQKEIKKFVLSNISGSLVSLVITSLLAVYYGVFGALLAATINQSIVFFVTLFFVVKSPWFQYSLFLAPIDKESLIKLGKFALMALTSALLAPVSKIVVRNYIGEHLSWAEAGYWQGVVRISDIYLMLITMTLSVYYLPRLSELQKKSEIRKELLYGLKIIMPIVVLMATSIFLLKDWVVALLFTEDFAPMKELFLWQLIGDVIKIISWLIAYQMLAKAMTKLFIFSEIFFISTFVILNIIFIDMYGLVGTTYAYTLNYFLFLLFMIWKFRTVLFYSGNSLSR
ncbi:MAG: O-antigen translocase [Pseudomonadota bacterium]